MKCDMGIDSIPAELPVELENKQSPKIRFHGFDIEKILW